MQRVKSYEVRNYFPEKKQKGRRDWQGKCAEQQAVYENRRRVRGEYGSKSFSDGAGELIERALPLLRDRRNATHLRGRQNILKRQLIQARAFHLSLILHTLLGAGTPRELKN
jgi:transposase